MIDSIDSASVDPASLASSEVFFMGQNRALRQLAAGAPLKDVFAALVLTAEADLGGQSVSAILVLDEDGKRLRHGAAPSLPDSYNRALDGIEIGPDIGTCCAAAARNEIVVTPDLEHAPSWDSFKALPLGLGLRAAWSMPIRSADGRVLGTFGTYFRECRGPTTMERELVGVLSRTAAVAIEQRATESALRASENFLQDVIRASPDCLKVIGLDGRVQWISSGGLCLLEVSDGNALLGEVWLSFWPEAATREKAQAAMDAARTGEFGRFQGMCPTGLGTPKWWDVAVTMIRNGEGEPVAFLGVSRDITAQKQAESSIRLSEERYRALVHATASSVWRVSGDTRTLLEFKSDAAGGLQPAPGGKHSWFDFIPADERPKIRNSWKKAAAEKSPFAHEHRICAAGRSLRYVQSRAVPLLDDAGGIREWIGASMDITERKEAAAALQRAMVGLETSVAQRTTELAQANAQLRTEIGERKKAEEVRQALLRQLASVEEDERRRISRELHDQVGQHLTALMLGLKSLRPHLTGALGEKLRSLEGITETVGHEVHELALELRPAALDDFGLGQALAHYLKEWSRRTGVAVQFEGTEPGAERFSPATETTLYRLIQEALTNVARHASAKRVAVVVERCPDHVLAIVEDDGRGFDVERALRGDAPQRLGLLGMLERAALCGGTVNIESSPGRGTTVFARIPLARAEGPHA